MAKYKRRDGTLVPETDPMHLITPHMVPDRCDNEAVLTELFDMTAVEAYLAKKNADGPEFKYTFFHVICAAIAKVLVLRPRMNRFYAGRRLYDRNDILRTMVQRHWPSSRLIRTARSPQWSSSTERSRTLSIVSARKTRPRVRRRKWAS